MRWFLPPWCVAESYELSYELWTFARENCFLSGRPPNVGILDLEIGNGWKKTAVNEPKIRVLQRVILQIVILCFYVVIVCFHTAVVVEEVVGLMISFCVEKDRRIQLKDWLTLTRYDLRWDELYRTEYVQTQTKPVILACPAFSKF